MEPAQNKKCKNKTSEDKCKIHSQPGLNIAKRVARFNKETGVCYSEQYSRMYGLKCASEEL